jgi:hypothetical protein
MDYIDSPSSLLEFFAELMGSIAGTLVSPRGMLMLLLCLVLGAFRRSFLWVVPVIAAIIAALLNVLLPLWSSLGMPHEKQVFEATYLVVSYFMVSVLGYSVGRTSRSIKYLRQEQS